MLGGAPADRRLRAYLLNLDTGESTDVLVSLSQGSVVSARALDTGAEGQLPIIDSEYHLVEEIVAADPDWRAALARRGLTDMTKIRICPITAGAFRRRPRTSSPDGPGARLPASWRARPGLGAPGRRGDRARRPDRQEGAPGHRRVHPAGPGRVR